MEKNIESGYGSEKLYIRWSDFKLGKKFKAFDMMEKIGDCLYIIFEKKGTTKVGLANSITRYGKTRNRVVVVDYWSPHLCVVRFKGVL